MKVKIQRSYTLENVAHEDIEVIAGALKFYKKTFPHIEHDNLERILRDLSEFLNSHQEEKNNYGI
jgi:hypothetical protein